MSDVMSDPRAAKLAESLAGTGVYDFSVPLVAWPDEYRPYMVAQADTILRHLTADTPAVAVSDLIDGLREDVHEYRKTATVTAGRALVGGIIPTMEGDHIYEAGDYLCGPGAAGEFWPVKRAIFEATYALIDAAPPARRAEDGLDARSSKEALAKAEAQEDIIEDWAGEAFPVTRPSARRAVHLDKFIPLVALDRAAAGDET